MADDPLASIQRHQQRDINLLFRTLADAVRNVAADLPADQPATTITSSEIMRELDEGLDVIFGRYPGDPEAGLRTLVLRDANRARLQPLHEAVQQYRKAMEAELREAIEAEVNP